MDTSQQSNWASAIPKSVGGLRTRPWSELLSASPEWLKAASLKNLPLDGISNGSFINTFLSNFEILTNKNTRLTAGICIF
jgi:hypothetical protein